MKQTSVMNSPIKGYVCVAISAVLWASSGTVGKALFAQGITPVELVQVRVGLSAIIMAITLALFARPLFRIRWSDLPYFLLLGGVILALVQFTYFFAISKLQVVAAVLIQYLAPILVAAYSICFWGERFTTAKAAALFLAVGGCYFVTGAYDLQLFRLNVEGVVAAFASAVLFSAYALAGERGMHRYRPWTVVFYAMVFAAVSFHIFRSPVHYLTTAHSAPQWAAMLYIAVFGTIVPFGLYFVGINHIRSTRALITGTLEPISAGLIAFIFLGESLEPLQIVGGALVIIAIVLLQLQREQDQLAPELVRNREAHPPPKDFINGPVVDERKR